MTESAKIPGLKSPTAKPRQAAPRPRSAVALNGRQRRYLRGLAHDRQPILQIGKAGAAKSVVDELDRALETHELVKIRVLRECPNQLGEIVSLVERSLGASTVGTVGRVAILYRTRSKDPSIALPDKANVHNEAPTSMKATKRTRSRPTSE